MRSRVASLNFILGYGGLVSFGHAAFFGIGGYAVAILGLHHHAGAIFGLIPGTDSFLVAVPVAMLVAGIAAALVGALSLRTSGVQFIMITLAFAQMLFFFFVSLRSYGGEDGIIMSRANALLDLNMRDRQTIYYVVLAVAAAYFLFQWRLVNSSFGTIIRGNSPERAAYDRVGHSRFISTNWWPLRWRVWVRGWPVR